MPRMCVLPARFGTQQAQDKLRELFPQKDQPVIVAEIKKKSEGIEVLPPADGAGISSPKNEVDAAVLIQSGMRGMMDRRAVAVKRADSIAGKTKQVLDEATGHESIVEKEEKAETEARPRRASVSSNLGSISETEADAARKEFLEEDEGAPEGEEAKEEEAKEEAATEEPKPTEEGKEEATEEEGKEEATEEEGKEEPPQEEPAEEPKKEPTDGAE